MNDIEQWLAERAPEAPSEALEQRMATLFDHHRRRGHGFRRPVPLWACAAACAAFLLFGFLLAPMAISPPPAAIETQSVVYILPGPPTPPLRNAFDWSQPAASGRGTGEGLQTLVVETFSESNTKDETI